MDVKKEGGKFLKTAGKFGAGFAGVAGGGVLASKIPDLEFLKKIPAVGDILAKAAPGVALMIIAVLAGSKFNNEYVERGAEGLGIAGILDILRRTGLLAKLNAAVPGGTGLSGNAYPPLNYGQYPPAYYLKSQWSKGTPMSGVPRLNGQQGVPRMNGLGNTAYALEGMGNASSDAYALAGKPSTYPFFPSSQAQSQKLQGLGNVAYGLEGFN